MNGITFEHYGNFAKTEDLFSRWKFEGLLELFDAYGKKGVQALSEATPVKTGKTAASWTYRIEYDNNHISLIWENTNKVKGYPIAFLLQYGHATRNGVYVQGRDYINPAMKPIFDELTESTWRRFLAY